MKVFNSINMRNFPDKEMKNSVFLSLSQIDKNSFLK